MIFDNTIATFAAFLAWVAADVQQSRPNKGKSPHCVQLHPTDPTKWYSLDAANRDAADNALYNAWVAGIRAELEEEYGTPQQAYDDAEHGKAAARAARIALLDRKQNELVDEDRTSRNIYANAVAAHMEPEAYASAVSGVSQTDRGDGTQLVKWIHDDVSVDPSMVPDLRHGITHELHGAQERGIGFNSSPQHRRHQQH